MGKKTSFTQNNVLQFLADATDYAEKACLMISGFQIRKLKGGGQWRYRYTDADGFKRCITIGKFPSIKPETAANEAISLAGEIAKGSDPLVNKSKKIEEDREYKKKQKANKQANLETYLSGIYTAHQARKSNEGKHTIDMISKHFKQWATLPMASITDIELKAWQAEKEKSGLSHSTIKRAFGAFRTMLRHAVREGVLEFDPSHKFQLQAPTAKEKSKKQQGEELRVRRMLTPNELTAIQLGIDKYKALLIKQRSNSIAHGKKELPSFDSVAHPHWFFPFFRLAAYTGLRTGDLYSLTWQELNLQFKRLVIIPNKTKHHSDPITVNLPLDDTITQIMKDWFMQLGSPSNGLVFPSPVNGNQMDKKAHIKHWKKVLSLGDVKSDLDFYSLRHHYISRLVAGSIPLFTVARLAGHKSVKMIEQHYGHLAPNAAIEALALIAGDFSPANTLTEVKLNQG
ncbi:MAG: integrase [Oleiphilaceae bacterium]|jgi:integrase